MLKEQIFQDFINDEVKTLFIWELWQRPKTIRGNAYRSTPKIEQELVKCSDRSQEIRYRLITTPIFESMLVKLFGLIEKEKHLKGLGLSSVELELLQYLIKKISV